MIAFYKGSNYDYHFIIKELAQNFKKQFMCLGENTEKYITFKVPKEKEVTRIDKMEKKLQKIYSTCCNLLIVLDTWQVYYQILSIIFLKEFIKVNVNTDMMIKNVKLMELHTKYETVFVNRETLKMI